MVSSFGFYQGVVRPAIFIVGPVLAVGEDGMGATAWGLVIAAQGVGALLGSLLLFWWRPARPSSSPTSWSASTPSSSSGWPRPSASNPWRSSPCWARSA
ncbi:hypothetical protein OIM90_32070 [Streptomyces sp. AD16]|nr:hypothetical protein OIM90_32070 [Streptomyces sp. AD16]